MQEILCEGKVYCNFVTQSVAKRNIRWSQITVYKCQSNARTSCHLRAILNWIRQVNDIFRGFLWRTFIRIFLISKKRTIYLTLNFASLYIVVVTFRSIKTINLNGRSRCGLNLLKDPSYLPVNQDQTVSQIIWASRAWRDRANHVSYRTYLARS